MTPFTYYLAFLDSYVDGDDDDDDDDGDNGDGEGLLFACSSTSPLNWRSEVRHLLHIIIVIMLMVIM